MWYSLGMMIILCQHFMFILADLYFYFVKVFYLYHFAAQHDFTVHVTEWVRKLCALINWWRRRRWQGRWGGLTGFEDRYIGWLLTLQIRKQQERRRSLHHTEGYIRVSTELLCRFWGKCVMSAGRSIGRVESCLVPGASTHGRTILLDLSHVTAAATWQHQTPATVTLHSLFACVCIP